MKPINASEEFAPPLQDTGNGYPSLQTRWFSGRSPRAESVTISIDRNTETLYFDTHEGKKIYPLHKVQWPERQRHGVWICHLPDGSLFQHDNGLEWDIWAVSVGYRETRVVSWMQSWRAVSIATVLLGVTFFGVWQWGILVASNVLVKAIPLDIDRRVGEVALRELRNRQWLRDSRISPENQKRWRDALAIALRQAYSGQSSLQASIYSKDNNDESSTHLLSGIEEWSLHFAQSSFLGPNALALPGGDIVVTDELLNLLAEHPNTLIGILAHEFGHIKERHGMKMLIQYSLASVFIGWLWGDLGSWILSIPIVLTTRAYSRDLEREADQIAAWILHYNGIHPVAMNHFFVEHLKRRGQDKEGLPISFSSHPPDEERITFFRDWHPK